ncbi:MAG TPA: peptidoglycan DD-metalloendopeptidase family protein [Anaerolineales bacterium]|nr:peptidoglycan DD-metalloendopeptidase family protein [Anaerolineales bacterium]HMV97628.1 peptidoglycan DD-metalloendopeptidase family protein [Anaerolineales bacterium]HMX18133.1 peptidoglycan DD-metalloendopeptidase family protein [Anaerolineales bacterium]HMX72642.1 peptidoglycan DD-metalloendopeptidase family protein [Anaerolineales bacterium]HMZ41633.1 peptidoglycan DD-metalloendopeptidase family protein [Anaerolineales bacterium]
MSKNIILLILILSLFFPFQPAQAQDTGGPIYIVQPGDSLSSIAERFSVSLADLMAVNGIANANQLNAGDALIIPGLSGITGTLNTEVVNFGDSYRSLIRRTQVSETLFKKLNHVVSPSEFYVGVSMIVPVQSGSQGLNKRISPTKGQSLLELAVQQNTDVWTLSHNNHLAGSWDSMPGDTLFTVGEDNAEQTTSGLPAAFISAEIRDLPIKQGGTGVIKVKTIPNVTLSGLLVDHALHFFPMEDGTQVALQGVHALLPPGVYPLRLEATLPDGSKQSFEQFILIISGNYPDDPLLYVDPATIDPASTEPELQQLIQLTLPSNPIKYWSGDFISPAIAYAESTYFTSRYGNRRTYIGQGTELQITGFHTGLDFGGGDGLPITAPAAGQVVFAGPLTVRGNATIIDHGWGIYSGFWHQSQINVQVGQVVQQNEVIGLVGGTGRVTGAHLHWELWVNGIQVDPLDWLILTYP